MMGSGPSAHVSETEAHQDMQTEVAKQKISKNQEGKKKKKAVKASKKDSPAATKGKKRTFSQTEETEKAFAPVKEARFAEDLEPPTLLALPPAAVEAFAAPSTLPTIPAVGEAQHAPVAEVASSNLKHVPDLSKCTIEELRQYCEDEGLKTSGQNKEDFINAIQAFEDGEGEKNVDESEEEDEDEEEEEEGEAQSEKHQPTTEKGNPEVQEAESDDEDEEDEEEDEEEDDEAQDEEDEGVAEESKLPIVPADKQQQQQNTEEAEPGKENSSTRAQEKGKEKEAPVVLEDEKEDEKDKQEEEMKDAEPERPELNKVQITEPVAEPEQGPATAVTTTDNTVGSSSMEIETPVKPQRSPVEKFNSAPEVEAMLARDLAMLDSLCTKVFTDQATIPDGTWATYYGEGVKQGFWFGGQLNGFGRVKAGRGVRYGYFRNDNLNGLGVYKSGGDVSRFGYFVDGQLHGKGYLFCDGCVCEGDFDMNLLRQGTLRRSGGEISTGTFSLLALKEGTKTFPSGRTEIGSFLETGALAGATCKLVTTDGLTYEGSFAKGVPVSGRLTYRDGSTYTGSFLQSEPHDSKGTLVNSDGNQIFTGAFAHGKKHGEGSISYMVGESRKLISGTWDNDKLVSIHLSSGISLEELLSKALSS